MSQTGRIQARHRLAYCISQVLGIQKTHNQQRQIRKVIIGCQKEKEQQSALLSSGPNDTQQPIAQALGHPLQSMAKGHVDMINLLSPSVKLIPNMVTNLRENVRETFGKCNAVYLRTRLHVGIIPDKQIRRDWHQRLPELFLFRYAGHTEHPKWKSSSKPSRTVNQFLWATKKKDQTKV